MKRIDLHNALIAMGFTTDSCPMESQYLGDEVRSSYNLLKGTLKVRVIERPKGDPAPEVLNISVRVVDLGIEDSFVYDVWEEFVNILDESDLKKAISFTAMKSYTKMNNEKCRLINLEAEILAIRKITMGY
jgi:hypothetical protein